MENSREEMCHNERRGFNLCHNFGQDNYRIHKSYKPEGKFSVFYENGQ